MDQGWSECQKGKYAVDRVMLILEQARVSSGSILLVISSILCLFCSILILVEFRLFRCTYIVPYSFISI